MSLLQIRKHVQRVLLVLQGHGVEHEVIDITLSEKREERTWMMEHAVPVKEGQNPLPPQIFNEEEYCGVRVEKKSMQKETFDRTIGHLRMQWRSAL